LGVARFVGIGIGEYDDGHAPLERAVPDVDAFAGLLGDGFTITLMANPAEQQVRDSLRALRGSMPKGGSLVVFWSGHAVPSPADGLRLLARDSGSYQSDGLGVSSDFAAPCAEAGANQLLLVVDTCFSGEAVMAGEVAARILRETASAKRPVWVGVLASCLPGETARDGVFGHRLVELLKAGPETPELRVRWSSHAMFIRGDDLCDALIKEWDSAAQTPAYLSRGSAVGMFPNPLYDPGAPERVVEHLLLAARGGEPQDDRSWFTGRTVEVDQVVAWVESGEAGLHVVTGAAGTGKTAIIGRVVSLANPAERERLLAGGVALGHADPRERSVDAHVHARGLTADRAADLLAGQLVRAGVLTPQNARRNAAELVGQIQRVVQDGAEPPVVVIDGLDEARGQAFAIAEDLVLRLARYAVVIVSTRELRRSPTDPSLLDLLTVDAAVLDLDAPASIERGRADVRAYVLARLAAVNPRMNPEAVAAHLAEQAAMAGNGQFLLARLVTDQLRATPVDTALPGWREKVSHSIGSAFDTDLALAGTPATPGQAGTHRSTESARVLLSALTVAFGAGLPEDEWLACANALTSDDEAFDRDDVIWVLDTLGRYIVQDGEAGYAVYRIAHQCIADHIRPPFAASYSQPFDPDTGPVTAALLNRYRILLASGMPLTGSWYLRRYAWRHAAASGPAGLELLRALAATEPQLLRDVAMAAEEVAAELRQWGHWRESVPVIEEATSLYRELAATKPTFRPDLARALNNLSVLCSEAGLRQEALSAVEGAVALYRDLAERNPSVTAGLAAALGNLSNHFRGTDRWRDGVALAEEAVQLLRPEPKDDPVSVTSLAGALTNLSIHYSDAGRWREALSSAEEAVTLFRELSEENPSFTYGLAIALISLSGRYNEAGHPVDAVTIAEEATGLYRGLARHNPAFLPNLASSLDHLGNQLSHAGNAQDAIDAAEEAVGLYRDLADSDSHYLDALAGALTHLGNHYSNAGRWEKVLGPSEEAVALYRQVSEGNAAFRGGLATALTNLASHYSETGRPQDALAPAEQALELRRRMAEENAALASYLAGALTNLGIYYSEVGREQDALAPAKEAVSLYRDLAEDNPAHVPGLASVLDNLSNRYGEVGDPATAIGLVKEAISLYRDVAQANPAVLPDLAMALGNLGNRLLDGAQDSDGGGL
jgi:tetratricopeptide (TPR) repeat protein